ncbi:GNAT family N-acetyltransferase [Flavihumibacter rivuli]|uniref:GNAT family N-acetyltransferase n=1 Tax=Flavihumibacter rivuli TaxID=2838156 RepID=UPI001BDEC209|nr:GNAT family N-acetyltransferase [Flavihumibacter rivuli]ULQ57974.1 GNAT family N-acetyltransferase [Flavihumibacter rivuli]
MILYRQVSNKADLQKILALQEVNLKGNLSEEEKNAQGFLTLQHSMEVLETMHGTEPSIIAMDGETLAGYALVMPLETRSLIPELAPMFDHFASMTYKGKPLNHYRYYVLGQVCVAAAYRGMGVFEGLYQMHRDLLGNRYDFVITEISTSNQRSLKAHARVGFTTILTTRDHIDEWQVVLWDFNKKAVG